MLDRSRMRVVGLACLMLCLIGAGALTEIVALVLTDAATARADLGHVITDAFAPLALILCAVVNQPWLERVAAILVALFVLGTAVAILLVAFDRLGTTPEQPGWLIPAGIVRALLDHRRARIAKSLDGRLAAAVRFDAESDKVAALLPAASGIVALLGFPEADPWIAMVVAAVVLKAAWSAIRAALSSRRQETEMIEDRHCDVPYAPNLFDGQPLVEPLRGPEAGWLWRGLLPTGRCAEANRPQTHRAPTQVEADLERDLVHLYKVTLGTPPWHDEVPMTAEQLRLIAHVSACQGLASRLQRDLDVPRDAWSRLREVVQRVHRYAPREWTLSQADEAAAANGAHRVREWLVRELLAGGYRRGELASELGGSRDAEQVTSGFARLEAIRAVEEARELAIDKADALADDIWAAAGTGPNALLRWVLGALYYRAVLDMRPPIVKRWRARRLWSWRRVPREVQDAAARYETWDLVQVLVQGARQWRPADRPWPEIPRPTPHLLEALEQAAIEAAGPLPSLDVADGDATEVRRDAEATVDVPPAPRRGGAADSVSALLDASEEVYNETEGVRDGFRMEFAVGASRAALRIGPEDGSREPCALVLSHGHMDRLGTALDACIARGYEPADVIERLQPLVEAGANAAAVETAVAEFEQEVQALVRPNGRPAE